MNSKLLHVKLVFSVLELKMVPPPGTCVRMKICAAIKAKSKTKNVTVKKYQQKQEC